MRIKELIKDLLTLLEKDGNLHVLVGDLDMTGKMMEE